MRILQVVQKPQRRGAEVFASELSSELRRAGHEVKTAYLYDFEGGGIAAGEEDFLLGGREGSPLERFPAINPSLLKKFLKAVDVFKPDIVQANGGRTLKYCAFARRLRKKDVWAMIYRNIGDPLVWFKGAGRMVFYGLFVMPWTDAVVCVSRNSLQGLGNLFKLKGPASVIPTGLNPSALVPKVQRERMRTEADAPPGAPVMLYVGSLSKEKRPDRLIRIYLMAKGEMPELRLWVVGDGPLKERLREMTAGVSKDVKFFGQREDVASYMNAADLLALTSDTEGVPGVILEAGLLGLPVVASKVGGVPECVLENETGFLVSPEDEKGFSDAVLRLAGDGGIRAEMGRKAALYVGENFTLRKIASRYLEFYEKALALRRRHE